MSEDFAAYRSAIAQRVNRAIDELVRNADSPFSDEPTFAATAGLFEAMRYALLGGGKRLRPLLLFATHQALHGNTADADLERAAVALE